MPKSRSCQHKTKAGKACGMPALKGSSYCYTHDPSKASERKAARVKGGYNRTTPARVSGDEAVQIVNAGDVLKLVNAVILDVWVQENTPQRARALLAAGDAAMRALDVGQYEDRIKALEEAIQHAKP